MALLTACGRGAAYAPADANRPAPAPENPEASREDEAAPVSPNVCIDRLGYEPDGSKTVIFRGAELPDTFTIRDKESGAVVYTGVTQKRKNVPEGTAYDSYGDFSDFTVPGSYYIQIARYGESYPFVIAENIYRSFFQRACLRLYEMRSGTTGEAGGWQSGTTGEAGEIETSLCMYQLLLSYELFPDVYSDDTGIAESGNEIPDILDECGYAVAWLLNRGQEQPERSGVCAIYRAAALAKYVWLTRNTDAELAGECLNAAEAAWKQGEKDLFVSDDLVAMAAAELYRLTGGSQYLGLAEEYLTNSAQKAEPLSDAEFFGSMTYLNTKNKVDRELCDTMMRKAMGEAEEIAELSRQNPFQICERTETADAAGLLRETLRICVVNHIITNHEYNTVIENHFHYLMGCNPDSICHVSLWDEEMARSGTVAQEPVQLSAVIFLLSGLLSGK